MKTESTFRNMALALGTICLVCSLLLGVVYSVTKDPIAAAEVAKVNEAIAKVVPSFDNVPSEEVLQIDGCDVYVARKGGRPVGYAVKVFSSGFGGQIQMMVGFTAEGTIHNTSVISHSETPGLGAKIAQEGDQAAAPRAQIVGKNPASTKLSVKADGGDIDAITASTITSRAFLKGVETAYGVFLKIERDERKQ